jgi:Kdo2-lipid IVA lauroyltransferase/acyltransferase
VNRLRARLEAGSVAVVGGLARVLGDAGSRRLGRLLGAAWHGVDRAHRRIARDNLRLAFPELPEPRRAAIARAAFRHFASIAIDLLRFPSYAAKDTARLGAISGWEHLEAAHAAGRGVLVASGHFGHWERVALLQGFRGRPMDMITRPLDNPYLEALLARGRTRSGNRVIHKRAAVRGMLRSLQSRRSVAIVIDQNYREENRMFVEFFGVPAATSPILGIVSVRSGAPIVPVFSWPLPDGRYAIEYHPPLWPEAAAERSAEAGRLTAAFTALLESQIRLRPEVWLWMHRRWRTRPAAEAAPLPVAAALAGGGPR